jgi:hypothetical protein
LETSSSNFHQCKLHPYPWKGAKVAEKRWNLNVPLSILVASRAKIWSRAKAASGNCEDSELCLICTLLAYTSSLAVEFKTTK